MSIFRHTPWVRDGRMVYALYKPEGKTLRNAFSLKVMPDYGNGSTVTEKECEEIAKAIELLPSLSLFVRSVTDHLRRGGYDSTEVFGRLYEEGQLLVNKLDI